jgi:hypothetical protein
MRGGSARAMARALRLLADTPRAALAAVFATGSRAGRARARSRNSAGAGGNRFETLTLNLRTRTINSKT